MWRDYFPNAVIIGVDKNSRVLFSEERIRTFGCDQSRISDLDQVADLPSFDLIVDDGSHDLGHQLDTAVFFVPKLCQNGLYIIEDVNEPSVLSPMLPFTHQVIQCYAVESKPVGSLILIEAEN